MYMVMLVLDNPDHLDDVLDNWHAIGIHGATIVESTGLQRRLSKRQTIPMRYTFPPVAGPWLEGNLTIFAIVLDSIEARKCLEAVEKVTGNLDDPNTGVFAAWPLAEVKGVPGLRGPGG